MLIILLTLACSTGSQDGDDTGLVRTYTGNCSDPGGAVLVFDKDAIFTAQVCTRDGMACGPVGWGRDGDILTLQCDGDSMWRVSFLEK